MLSDLPPEIIKPILKHLLLQGVKFWHWDTNQSRRGLCGYHILRLWNNLSNANDILSFAHTCKYFQSIVYPVIFDSVSYARTPELATRATDEAPVWHLPPEDEGHNPHACFGNSALNSSLAPQFCLELDLRRIPQNALQRVRRLFLSIERQCEHWNSWMPDAIKLLPSLEEIYLNLCLSPETYHAVRNAIECILDKDPKLRVHLQFDFAYEVQQHLITHLIQFNSIFARWEELNVESIHMNLNNPHCRFPPQFFDSVQKFGNLKTFSILLPHLRSKRIEVIYLLGWTEIADIPKLLENSPKLTKLHLDTFEYFRLKTAPWKPSPCLRELKNSSPPDHGSPQV